MDKGKTKDQRVNALANIPDQSYADDYIGRTIAGVDFMTIFDRALSNHYNVMLKGPTGSGKTTAVLAYASRRKKRFYSVSSTIGVEPSQLFGKYIPNEDTKDGGHLLTWQDGPVTDLFRHGGVLLINEVNFLPERVASVLFSALDKRREIQLPDHKGEVIHAHDDLLIVVDMNPGYEGTRPPNKAFANRFAVQLDWDYDTATEQKLVKGPLHGMAAKFRKQVAEGVFETPVSTNMLIEFDTMASDSELGFEFAVEVFANHFGDEDERNAVKKYFEDAGNDMRGYYRKRVASGDSKSSEPKDEYEDWIVGDVDEVARDIFDDEDEENVA